MKLEEKLVLQTFWEKIKKYFATKLYVATLKSSKQDTLIAGKGIRIVNNVISNSLFPYKYKNDQGEWVIQGSDEKVIVTLFGPTGFNLANRQITLTYYQNNEPILPARVITKTTDSNGVVIFSSNPNDLGEGEVGTGVPVGYEYEITFPKIANYQEITPEKHVAGVVERNIEVTYVKLPDISEDDYGEEITIHLDKFENNEVTPFEGVNVSVKIGTATATTYTTDENGNVILKKDNNGNDIPLKIRYGQSYTVTVPTMTDYYIPAAAYTQTYTSEKRKRDISFTYKFIKVGIFIVDKYGDEYTGEEWEQARDVDQTVINEDAVLLKVVTSTLAAYDGIFAIDIDDARKHKNIVNNIAWSNIATQFYSIPNISTAGSNSYPQNSFTYLGYSQSLLIQQEGDDRGISTPAVDRCLSFEKILISRNGEFVQKLNGFLCDSGQVHTLISNITIVNNLLEIVRPASEKPDGVTYYTVENLGYGICTCNQYNDRCYRYKSRSSGGWPYADQNATKTRKDNMCIYTFYTI